MASYVGFPFIYVIIILTVSLLIIILSTPIVILI